MERVEQAMSISEAILFSQMYPRASLAYNIITNVIIVLCCVNLAL